MHSKDYQVLQTLDAMTAMLSAFAVQLDRMDERIANLERRSGRLNHVCYQPPTGDSPPLSVELISG